jgi:hypothetical protein
VPHRLEEALHALVFVAFWASRPKIKTRAGNRMRSSDGVWSELAINNVQRQHRLKFYLDAEAEHQHQAHQEQRYCGNPCGCNPQWRDKQEEGSEAAQEGYTEKGKDKACHQCFQEHPCGQQNRFD